jgi:hypothetical protein
VTRNNKRQLHVTRPGRSPEIPIHRAAAAGVEAKPIGRPTDYTPEIARKITDQMIDGHSLRAICQDCDMPGEGTVYRWIARHPEFREIYAHARELQAMRWGEEVLTIADDKTLDPHERRIRVDSRKWLLAKLLPKVYGDKVTVAGDSKAPLHHVVAAIDFAALSDAELDALKAFAEARLLAIAQQNRDKGSDNHDNE